MLGPFNAPALHDQANKLFGGFADLGHRDEKRIRWLRLVVAPFNQQRDVFVVAHPDADPFKTGYARSQRSADQLEGQFGFGGTLHLGRYPRLGPSLAIPGPRLRQIEREIDRRLGGIIAGTRFNPSRDKSQCRPARCPG